MMRGAPNKQLLLYLVGLMTIFPGAAAHAEEAGKAADANHPVQLYNPQGPKMQQATQEPAPQTTDKTKSEKNAEPFFAPKRFLQHPGRIHYDQKARNNKSRKSANETDQQSAEDTDNRQQENTGKRQQYIVPPRKPRLTDQDGHSRHVKPLRKPDRRRQTAQQDKQSQTAKSGDSSLKKRHSEKTEKTAKAQMQSEMPAVPPGNVDADTLENSALPKPSDTEASSWDGNVTRQNAADDGILQRLMLRPPTAELVASVEDVADQVPKNAGDREAAPDAEGSTFFAKTSQDKKSDYQLIYQNGMRDLNEAMRDNLRQYVLTAMQKRPGSKLVIKSYATSADSGRSSDRRIALARALKLREFLIRNNLDSNRMNIRALGDASKTPPRNRIDLLITAP